MHIENLSDLQKLLRLLGFGLMLEPDGEGPFRDPPPGPFSLETEGTFLIDEVMLTTLFFEPNGRDCYSLQRFTCTLFLDAAKTQYRRHTFTASPVGITHKEAYNLLSGRSVYKETLPSQEGPAWIRLDLTDTERNGSFAVVRYSHSYGYRVEPLLAMLPIVEMEQEALRLNTIKGLQKGCRMLATFKKPTKTEHYFIEACPQRKCIVIRDLLARPVQLSRSPP